MARACLLAADEERAPIMLQTGPDDFLQASPGVMTAMVRALAEEASVPVMLHLDHGDGFLSDFQHLGQLLDVKNLDDRLG
jgi:fructose/tagatose bisphosphate aldolase